MVDQATITNGHDPFRRYFIEEFFEDYRDGLINRRAFTRKVAFITGSMAAAAAAMAAAGCTEDELPAADEPMPTPVAAEPTTPPAPSAASPSATAMASSTSPGTAAPFPSIAAATSTPSPTAAASTPSRVATVVPSVTASAAPQATQAATGGTDRVAEGDLAIVAVDVTFLSGPDEIGGYFARPAEGGRRRAVMICHENRGLTEHIRDVTRRFARAGYVALALDLLWREGGTAATDPDAVPGALSAAGAERHVGDFKAALAYLRTLDAVEPGRIGMTGYCFGGGITWRSATAMPELKAAVPFYGPAPDLGAVKNIKAAVLGVYAELDTRINASIDSLAQALKDAGVVHEIKVYPGVNHAFHNDTGSRYDKAQATQAWLDTLAWFDRYL